jgi:cytochrome oxidase assembly protein ShyY1
MKFRPNWKLTLFYLVLFPLLVGLGCWQLYRADYKQGLQTLYEQRSAASPISLNELKANQDVAYLPVKLKGRFDNRRYFLLDNRVFQGRPGYEVINPFELTPVVVTAGGDRIEWVWVNRGWVPMQADRSVLPAIDPVEGGTEIAGQLITPGEAFVLAEEPLSGRWPEVIQRVELEKMNERAAVKAGFPYLFRLRTDQPGSFEVNWQAVNTAPEKSLGYAVQWFLMALVLTGLFVWAGIQRTENEEASDRNG